MMKRCKRAIGIVCLIVMLISVLAVGVSASCIKGYGTYSIGVDKGWWLWEKDEAYASLTKCNCTPVKNELMVWLQIQYREGNEYKWLPSEDRYRFDHGDNIAKAQITISEKNITYAHAIYYATCGDNPQNSFEREYAVD